MTLCCYFFQTLRYPGESDSGGYIGGAICIVIGIGKSTPTSATSPCFKLGRNDAADLSISPHALSTTSRSLSFVNLWTNSVPIWLNTPSVISLGL